MRVDSGNTKQETTGHFTYRTRKNDRTTSKANLKATIKQDSVRVAEKGEERASRCNGELVMVAFRKEKKRDDKAVDGGERPGSTNGANNRAHAAKIHQ